MDTELGSWGPRWFRPFGKGGDIGPHLFSRAAVELLKAERYSVLIWNSVPRDWEDTDGWVDRALADVARQEHTVLVLHDLPTGAMQHLNRFLDQVEARGVELVVDLPTESVPFTNGQPESDQFETFVADM